MTLVDQTITHEQEYRIDELVYDGSMNSIYSGTWKRLEQTIYVSVLSGLDSLKLTRKAVQRIRGNLHENVGRLQHPNLPDIIDYGEGDHLAPFTIMRLPPGRLLVQKLQDDTLGTLETYRIVHDVAAALRACRDAGLPHRGPTADRVWVTEDGRAILLGLGEVLFRHDSYSMGGTRRVDLIWHLPPEAFPDDSQPDDAVEEVVSEPPNYREQLGGTTARVVENSEAAEVFALGALAYHCLAGHHPFFGTRTAPSSGIAALLTNAKLELDHRLVREPIDVALSPDPNQRFPNAEEFLRELRDRLRISPSVGEPTGFGSAASFPGESADRTDDDEHQATSDAVTDDASNAATMLWRGVAALLFVALLIYAYLDLRRPTSVIVTSTPAGIELEEVTGHLTESRGRTPVILRDRARTEKVTFRALGPNGEQGPAVTIDPSTLQDLGRCARVHLDAQFVEREPRLSPNPTAADDHGSVTSPTDELVNEPETEPDQAPGANPPADASP